MSIVDRISLEMSCIGVDVVHVIDSEAASTLLLRGKGNKRLASHPVPSGVVSTADEAEEVAKAVSSIKYQLSSKSGGWPEGYPA